MSMEQENETPEGDEVPEGAFILPIIPEELGVHPLLLAVLHSVLFFDGSTQEVIHDAAADEMLNYLAGYLQRLQGAELNRIREDMECVASYAKQEDWPKDVIQFLQNFLTDFGVGEE